MDTHTIQQISDPSHVTSEPNIVPGIDATMAAQHLAGAVAILDRHINDRLLTAANAHDERRWWRVKIRTKQLLEVLPAEAISAVATAIDDSLSGETRA